MCRYALNNYKQTWSCFSCRKSFKKTNLSDYLRQTGDLEKYRKLAHCRLAKNKQAAEARYQTTAFEIEKEYFSKVSVCPDCGDLMANMGMDFKSPKMTDLKSWKIIEGMYRVGAIYQTCGCEGLGFVPSNSSDYIRYLNERIVLFEERKHDSLNNSDLNAYQRGERASYWASKIERLKVELQKNAAKRQTI